MNRGGTPDNLNKGGNEGNRFGAGRPRNAWREACAGLVSSDEVFELLRGVIVNPEHPAWLGAFKFAAEQGYGRAKESVEHSGEFAQKVVIMSPEDYEKV